MAKAPETSWPPKAGAAAGEEPEALGVEAPDRRVDEDRAVVLQQQRVGDLAGHQVVEVARLQALELRLVVELVNAHEREVEQAGGTPGREMLLDGAHSVRMSSRPPVATQRTPASRRRTSALATWARRTSDDHAEELEHRDHRCRIPVDESLAIVLDRARGGGDDLQHLAGGDRGERRVAQDHHQRHREQRPARAGEARAEAGDGADAGEEPGIAGPATRARLLPGKAHRRRRRR